MAKNEIKSQEKHEEKWDEAIAHCQRELAEIESRIPQLKAAIETFKANKKLRKPWPGSTDSVK